MTEYAPGRRVLVDGSPDRGVALLWHGRGVDGANWMRPLGRRVAAGGVLAVAPDWNTEAPDGGRSDLLASLRFARQLSEQQGLDPDAVVVAGWSMGGTAAARLAMHDHQLAASIGGLVLIAPGGGLSPSPPGDGACRIDIVYGSRDTVTPPDLVAGLELRLRVAGWRTALHETDTDHGGIVGTRFDPRTEQYLPSTADHAVSACVAVAALIGEAATSSS